MGVPWRTQMAIVEECMMKISWVFGNATSLDPTVDIARMKNLGSSWGGWQTWRMCQTDNVICNDMEKAHELIRRNFQSSCNLYIPNSVYVALSKPDNVQVYNGEFKHDVDNREEIVAMHLVAQTSDIILLLGFDLSERTVNDDKLMKHKQHNYLSLIKQVMLDTNKQWVLLDHAQPPAGEFGKLPNLTNDTLENVLNTVF